MLFLPVKIAFFWAFENNFILSSKSYTATKSGIAPQQKSGSLQNLKLKLTRHELIISNVFCKDPCTHICARAVNASVHNKLWEVYPVSIFDTETFKICIKFWDWDWDFMNWSKRFRLIPRLWPGNDFLGSKICDERDQQLHF